MLAIGYADEAPRARPRLSQLVSFERFGNGAPQAETPEPRPAPRAPRAEPVALEMQDA